MAASMIGMLTGMDTGQSFGATAGQFAGDQFANILGSSISNKLLQTKFGNNARLLNRYAQNVPGLLASKLAQSKYSDNFSQHSLVGSLLNIAISLF